MTTIDKLRDTFQRRRYGGTPGDYDPDIDLLDVAADEIERLTAERDAALARAAMWDGIQRGTYDAMTAEVERLRAALDEYQCPGLADCPVQKLKDGSCINAGVGHCGDMAFRALHQQQAVNSEEGK